MIRIISENYVIPEKKEEYLKLCEELINKSRSEEGNISYDLLEDINDEYHLTFLETWKDEEAIKLHNESEHFTRIVPLIALLKSKPGKLTKYK